MEGLTERDKNARSFEDALSSQKRTVWPEIAAPSVTGKDSDYDNDPLNDLQKSMVLHAQGMAEQNPAYTQEGTDGPIEIEKWTVKQAMQHLESLRPFLEESR